MCWPSTVPHQACRMAPARRVCPILIVTLADQGNPALKPHPQEADQEAQVCEQDLRRLPGPQSRQGKVNLMIHTAIAALCSNLLTFGLGT